MPPEDTQTDALSMLIARPDAAIDAIRAAIALATICRVANPSHTLTAYPCP